MKGWLEPPSCIHIQIAPLRSALELGSRTRCVSFRKKWVAPRYEMKWYCVERGAQTQLKFMAVGAKAEAGVEGSGGVEKGETPGRGRRALKKGGGGLKECSY